MYKTILLASTALVLIFFYGSIDFTNAVFPSPNQQIRSGVALTDVQCNGGKVLVAISDVKVFCVNEDTATKKNWNIINYLSDDSIHEIKLDIAKEIATKSIIEDMSLEDLYVEKEHLLEKIQENKIRYINTEIELERKRDLGYNEQKFLNAKSEMFVNQKKINYDDFITRDQKNKIVNQIHYLENLNKTSQTLEEQMKKINGLIFPVDDRDVFVNSIFQYIGDKLVDRKEYSPYFGEQDHIYVGEKSEITLSRDPSMFPSRGHVTIKIYENIGFDEDVVKKYTEDFMLFFGIDKNKGFIRGELYAPDRGYIDYFQNNSDYGYFSINYRDYGPIQYSSTPHIEISSSGWVNNPESVPFVISTPEAIFALKEFVKDKVIIPNSESVSCTLTIIRQDLQQSDYCKQVIDDPEGQTICNFNESPGYTRSTKIIINNVPYYKITHFGDCAVVNTPFDKSGMMSGLKYRPYFYVNGWDITDIYYELGNSHYWKSSNPAGSSSSQIGAGTAPHDVVCGWAMVLIEMYDKVYCVKDFIARGNNWNVINDFSERNKDTAPDNSNLSKIKVSSQKKFVDDGREYDIVKTPTVSHHLMYDKIMSYEISPDNIDDDGMASIKLVDHKKYSAEKGYGLYIEDWVPTHIPDGFKMLYADTYYVNKYFLSSINNIFSSRHDDNHIVNMIYVSSDFVLHSDTTDYEIKKTNGFRIKIDISSLPFDIKEIREKMAKLVEDTSGTYDGFKEITQDGKTTLSYSGGNDSNQYKAVLVFFPDKHTQINVKSNYLTLDELIPVFESIMNS